MFSNPFLEIDCETKFSNCDDCVDFKTSEPNPVNFISLSIWVAEIKPKRKKTKTIFNFKNDFTFLINYDAIIILELKKWLKKLTIKTFYIF